MVDPRRLADLLDRVADEVDHLRRLSARGERELLADDVALPAAKYRLVVAVEACVDAAHHVIASQRLRAPQSFADAFVVLGEAGHLDDGLAAAMADAARFRNLLVHQYADVDDRRVLDVLEDHLGDLDAFCANLSRHVRGA